MLAFSLRGTRHDVSSARRYEDYTGTWSASEGLKTKKGGRYAEPWVPEGRKGETACLARPWKLRRPEVTGPGVSALEVRRNYGVSENRKGFQ